MLKTSTIAVICQYNTKGSFWPFQLGWLATTGYLSKKPLPADHPSPAGRQPVRRSPKRGRVDHPAAGQLVPISSDLPAATLTNSCKLAGRSLMRYILNRVGVAVRWFSQHLLNQGRFETCPKFPPATLTHACERQIDPLPGGIQKVSLLVWGSFPRGWIAPRWGMVGASNKIVKIRSFQIWNFIR